MTFLAIIDRGDAWHEDFLLKHLKKHTFKTCAAYVFSNAWAAAGRIVKCLCMDTGVNCINDFGIEHKVICAQPDFIDVTASEIKMISHLLGYLLFYGMYIRKPWFPWPLSTGSSLPSQ